MQIAHHFDPVYNGQSKILILGTMPSPKSRENGFYYGHPQNRFWKTLAGVFHEKIPKSIAEKTAFLLAHHIALWDVLKSCDISGAADSSIRNPVANDFSVIFSASPIQQVFTTGKTAGRLYQKLTGNPCIMLPSPSPANCRFSLAQLVVEYSQILNHLP